MLINDGGSWVPWRGKHRSSHHCHPCMQWRVGNKISKAWGYMWNDQGRRQHCNHRAKHGPSERRVCGYADKRRRRTCARSRAHCSWRWISYIWRTCNLSIFTGQFWPKGVLLVWMLLPHIPMSADHTTMFTGAVDLHFVVCKSQHGLFLAFWCIPWTLVIFQ